MKERCNNVIMAINIVRKSNRQVQSRVISEINVTPMVDVVLVLLITFMVTSPMLGSVKVTLPEAAKSPLESESDIPLVISINKEGEIFIGEMKIHFLELNQKIRNMTEEKKDTRIFVKGDKNISYGKIIEIVSEISNAGFTKVILISEMKHN